MSWDQNFIDALSSPSLTPTYRLRFWVPSVDSVGADVTIYSDRGPLRIGARGIQIQGTSVIPSRWSVSFGGFSLELVGDLRPYKDQIQKGSMAIAECSFIGLSAWQTVALGQLDSVAGFRGVFKLNFKDILSAFQSRIDTRYSLSLEYNKLFFSTAINYRVASNWTAGTTSLVLTGVSALEKPTSLDGVIYCIPSSGDPFYMRWSSADPSTNTLTLTSGSASHPSTTSAVNLTSGDFVYNCVRINGTPYSFLGKIITSTGAGTNGPYDVLPANWSTGAPIPWSMYDYSDAQATSAYLKPATGTAYVWDYVAREPLSNGLRDILTTLANAGQWPVFRQDSFSWRGCTDPTGQFDDMPPVVAYIKDRDIVRIESHLMHDPSLAAVYGSTKLIYDVSGTATTTTNPDVYTLPSQGQVVRDMGAMYDSAYNEAAMGEGDIKRLKIWDIDHWSRLTLRVSLRFAVLVAGDVVRITSNYLYDLSTQNGRTYDNRGGMVISTEYNISGRFCVIVIAIPPIA